MDSNSNLRSQSETQVGPVGREDSEEVSQLSQTASKSGEVSDLRLSQEGDTMTPDRIVLTVVGHMHAYASALTSYRSFE